LEALHPLLIRDFCIATSIGAGTAVVLAALKSGRSGLRPCHFETADLPTYVGEIDGLENVRLEGALAVFDCRNHRLAELALRQDGFEAAVNAAKQRHGANRIGIFLGTSTAGILQSELAYRARDPDTGALPAWFDYQRTHNTYSLASFVSERLGLHGPSIVISCACASTAKAFGSAARMIEAGLCDAAIVGGADSLCLTTLYGFQSLNLTAAGPCRPFDADRDGISIGEGAGFALLERAELDVGVDGLFLLGIGESNDAYHMSSPHPEGVGARLAMERALASAGLGPANIDYLNLHGTATRVGDAAEDRAIFEMFGGATPCSSTKGQTGHTLGAAGIVEAVISLLAIRHGTIPANANTVTIDPAFRSRHVTAGTPAQLDRAISNSFGFGGSNCSLILGRTL
jgi:3-oxoacyl-[acyl-carrier-protein] synthase I